jgi:hypothetical protein
MQVDVHDVHAKVAGPRDAHQGIEVCAIHIHHGAFGVQDVRDFRDLRFEHSEGIRVGHHERGALQHREVHQALVV